MNVESRYNEMNKSELLEHLYKHHPTEVARVQLPNKQEEVKNLVNKGFPQKKAQALFGDYLEYIESTRESMYEASLDQKDLIKICEWSDGEVAKTFNAFNAKVYPQMDTGQLAMKLLQGEEIEIAPYKKAPNKPLKELDIDGLARKIVDLTADDARTSCIESMSQFTPLFAPLINGLDVKLSAEELVKKMGNTIVDDLLNKRLVHAKKVLTEENMRMVLAWKNSESGKKFHQVSMELTKDTTKYLLTKSIAFQKDSNKM